MNIANTAQHRRLQEDIALSKSSYNMAWARARAIYGSIANPRLGEHQTCVCAIPHFVLTPSSLLADSLLGCDLSKLQHCISWCGKHMSLVICMTVGNLHALQTSRRLQLCLVFTVRRHNLDWDLPSHSLDSNLPQQNLDWKPPLQ